nr:endolytic transglycosylase MltG [Legionellales bacterium]
MRIRGKYFLLLGVGLLVIGAGLLYLDWQRFLQRPFTQVDSDYIYYLPPGYTLQQVAQDLTSQQLLTHKRDRYYLRLLGQLTGQANRLKTGEYWVTSTTTAHQLLDRMVGGDVVMRLITLVEGWNFWQIRDAMIANPYIRDTLVHLPTAEIVAQLSLDYPHLEGLFFPETYQFARGVSDHVILQQAAKLMQEKLQLIWQQRQPNLPYKTAYEALIAASIIEKETAIDAERPVVSSVIVNRLRKGMRLQVDPTVIYGLGEHYQGPLTRADLRKDTPHNTYRRHGLPPTPIAMPSESSLRAAVQPATTSYYYFVAQGDGSHEFSVTLEQQNAAVNRYRRRQADLALTQQTTVASAIESSLPDTNNDPVKSIETPSSEPSFPKTSEQQDIKSSLPNAELMVVETFSQNNTLSHSCEGEKLCRHRIATILALGQVIAWIPSNDNLTTRKMIFCPVQQRVPMQNHTTTGVIIHGGTIHCH